MFKFQTELNIGLKMSKYYEFINMTEIIIL
jgi:hypothetical protein